MNLRNDGSLPKITRRYGKSPGFSLVELLVVLIITSAFIVTTGALLVTTLSMATDEKGRIDAESQIQYFMYGLEREFRSAIDDPVAMDVDSGNRGFRFVSYYNNGNMLNQYVQHYYYEDGGPPYYLKHTRTPCSYVGGVLTFDTANAVTEVIMPVNNYSTSFCQGLFTTNHGTDLWYSTAAVYAHQISPKIELSSGKYYNHFYFMYTLFSMNRKWLRYDP